MSDPKSDADIEERTGPNCGKLFLLLYAKYISVVCRIVIDRGGVRGCARCQPVIFPQQFDIR